MGVEKKSQERSYLLALLPFLIAGVFLLPISIALLIIFFQGNRSFLLTLVLFVTFLLAVISISVYAFALFVYFSKKRK